MTGVKRSMMMAAGSAGGGPLYVEDVFSTYIYDGTSATRTITNGIDLDGEGGMVWFKGRDTGGGGAVQRHGLYDTERGVQKRLMSDTTAAEATESTSLTAFNSNGFTVSSDAETNQTNYDYASWTFRKAEGFFDVVTWTGNAVDGREIPHNLGSVPGCIIAKRLNTTQEWTVQHRKSNNGVDFEDYAYALNTNAYAANQSVWNDTAPTASVFTIDADSRINGDGSTYVAYLFAHDVESFGADEDESIIQCGNYTGTVSAGLKVSLGWEPQWLMVKAADSTAGTGGWAIFDDMRGMPAASQRAILYAHDSAAELNDTTAALHPTADGFQIDVTHGFINTSGGKYIYIAIRRPMKTPGAGTEVFATDTRGSTGDGKEPTYRSPFPVDMQFNRNRTYAGGNMQISSRIMQTMHMHFTLEGAETTNAGMMFDYQNGVQTDTGTGADQTAWMFKRAPGFFDIVNYTGNSSASGQVIAHGLTVEPEMIIIKNRDTSSRPFHVYAKLIGDDKAMFLPAGTYESNNGLEGGTHNATQFELKQDFSNINGSGQDYLALLFATLAGVSKVGVYTADETVTTIDCGFSGGARFVLIKKKGSGNWFFWDSDRGIVAGDDPYLLLNTNAAEVTTDDWIDPHNSGFQITDEAGSVSGGVNIDTEDYLFLAIA